MGTRSTSTIVLMCMPKGGHRWRPAGDKNSAFKGGIITDREWFCTKYEDEELSLREISKLAGRSLRTAARWAKIHEVKTRLPGHQRTQLFGEQHPNWKGGCGVCSVCGGKASPRKREEKTRCMKCRTKAYTGEGNPNYRGVADISALLRQYLSDTWRLRVFARDHYTCQKCGDAKGGNLTAHHIIRFAVIVKKHLKGLDLSIDTLRLEAVEILKAVPEMNDLTNGVTLCKACHRNLHTATSGDRIPLER